MLRDKRSWFQGGSKLCKRWNKRGNSVARFGEREREREEKRRSLFGGEEPRQRNGEMHARLN